MVDLKRKSPSIIGNEMSSEQINYWFDFKKSKFLHNIDTFYYSVKFQDDFTIDTTDCSVLRLRKFFYKNMSCWTTIQKLNSFP